MRRAAEVLGSYEALGAHLGIRPRTLEHWSMGLGAPNETLFLQIVDIVLGDGPTATH